MNIRATPDPRTADETRALEALRKRLEALQRVEAFTHEVQEFELLETHISYVLLTGPFAYKFKKPIRLPFLDFSTLEQRRRCCAEEVRLNRRTAPALYTGVVEVTDSDDGPVIDGGGPVADYAVKMVQFPTQARADLALARGEIEGTHIDAFAELVGGFHEAAKGVDSGSPHGNAESVQREARGNVSELRRTQAAGALPSRFKRLLAKLERWTARSTQDLRPVFERRRRAGRVRECHGDLHLANVALLNGVLTPFDCIEFNDSLRWIDTMSDLAFALMDLEVHDRPDLARQLLNGYLERTGDYNGLSVLRHYEVYRALVRAKVAAIEVAIGAKDSDAGTRLRQHLVVADRIANVPWVPRLILLCGPSGAGKSWLARQLIPHGAFIEVRSDVERRRLFGTWPPSTQLDSQCTPYTAQATQQTYDRLSTCANAILRAGHPVLVDATFLDRSQRDRFRALAHELDVPFRIVDVVAPKAVLEARVMRRAQRRDDASEADVEVLRRQLESLDPLAPEERRLTTTVDTQHDIDAAALAATLLEA